MKTKAVVLLVYLIILSSCSKRATGELSVMLKNENLDNSIITNVTLYQTKKNEKIIKRRRKIYFQDSLNYNYQNTINFKDVSPGTYNLYVHIFDSTKRCTGRILEIKINEGSNIIDKSIVFDTIKFSNDPNKSLIPKLKVSGLRGLF